MSTAPDRHVAERPPEHARERDEHRRVLRRSVVVLVVLLVAQVVGGLLTGSLALLSDAGHVVTDLVGLLLALAAVTAAQRTVAAGRRSFGLHRLEVLAALANAVLLTAVAAWVVVEAVGRIAAPSEVDAPAMLAVAVVGLLGNLLVLHWMRGLGGESLNVEGARLEVLADTLGSVAVIVGGIVVAVTGLDVVDALVAAGIALVVLPRTFRLATRAVRILIQAAPEGLDLDALAADLLRLDGVAGVHDLHAWTLTSGIDVATVHLGLDAGTADGRLHDLLDEAHAVLRAHGLEHATVQLEPPAHDGCDPHATWTATATHTH